MEEKRTESGKFARWIQRMTVKEWRLYVYKGLCACMCMRVCEWLGECISTRNRMYIILTWCMLRVRICANASGDVDERKLNLLCSRQRTHRHVVRRYVYTHGMETCTWRLLLDDSFKIQTNPCALIGTLVQRSNHRAFFRDNVIVKSIWHSEIWKIDGRLNERVWSANVSTIRDPINLLNRFISRETIS